MNNIKVICFCLNYFLPFDLYYLFCMPKLKPVGGRTFCTVTSSVCTAFLCSKFSFTESSHRRAGWQGPRIHEVHFTLLEEVQDKFIASLRQASKPRKVSGQSGFNALHSTWKWTDVINLWMITTSTDLLLTLPGAWNGSYLHLVLFY